MARKRKRKLYYRTPKAVAEFARKELAKQGTTFDGQAGTGNFLAMIGNPPLEFNKH